MVVVCSCNLYIMVINTIPVWPNWRNKHFLHSLWDLKGYLDLLQHWNLPSHQFFFNFLLAIQSLDKSAVLINFDLVHRKFQSFSHLLNNHWVFFHTIISWMDLWHRKVYSGHQIFIYFIDCILICTKDDTINGKIIRFQLEPDSC